MKDYYVFSFSLSPFYFFFLIYIFYWRIIALQNFVVFCQTSTWISHRYTYFESEKVGWKLNIQKTKIMASGPIMSWYIDGETVAYFIFLGSKITADGDCSHDIKRRLPLGRNVMTHLDNILESRNICLVKAMVFPVVMYGCESWNIKKAERQRIDAFEL